MLAAKLFLNHALTTLVRTFGLLRHSLTPTNSLDEIRYAKFFLATSEYREVARSIFQNVAPKFFSLVCSDPETTRLLESGTSAINQQVSAKNEKTGCDIVRIIEGALLRTVRGDAKIEVDPE
jgi:hypothetical protein